MVNAPGLIVVFKENRIPAVFSGVPLAVTQNPLQVRKRPVSTAGPVDLIVEVNQHMGEFEDHIKNTLVSDPLGKL